MTTPEHDWTALEARLTQVLEEVEQAQVVHVATLLKYEQLFERGVKALESIAEHSYVISLAAVHIAHIGVADLVESIEQERIIRRWHRQP